MNPIIKKELDNNSKFYTQENNNVTERIINGTTTAFFDVNEALKFAKKKKTYVYPLNISKRINKTQYTEPKHYCLAVPN